MPLRPNALSDLIEVFEMNFRDRGELGASVSVWQDGHELLSLGHGWCEREELRAWTTDTMVPVYSATKTPAAACLLLALHQHGMSEQTLVCEVWPKFPVKQASFAQLLSHQCGLAALDERVDVFDHEAVVALIEQQTPYWSLGDGHGYHTRTYSALVDEPVRRLTGLPLGDFWREEIADPLDLDFWIGLPEREFVRVAKLYPGKATQNDLADGFYKALTSSGTFTRKAFASPQGLHAVIGWSWYGQGSGQVLPSGHGADFRRLARERATSPSKQTILCRGSSLAASNLFHLWSATRSRG